MTKEVKIMISIAALLILGGGALLLLEPAPAEPGNFVDQSRLIREHNTMTGSLDAKVTVVEFGDMQCPACASAHPVVKQIINEYGDNPDFNFVFRHFPLSSIHPHAQISAEAVEAAGDQGKFWEMHDLLFTRQSEWASGGNPLDKFVAYAGELGLDTGSFKQAIESRQFAQLVQADLSDGEQLGVYSTPTFIVNGQMYRGVLNLDEFKTIIDEALSAPEENQNEETQEEQTSVESDGNQEQNQAN